MVASEVDGFIGTINSSNSNSSSTHIYCKPVKIKDATKTRNLDSRDSTDQSKNMISDVKVPSSVVAIDVSGQPFSRMSSFRRSLIHVDFLIRRKRKKDKRRNTVAEGDVKELKDALQKIVNEECQFTIPNGINSYQQIIAESKNAYNSKAYENQQSDKSSMERNNNTNNTKLSEKDSYNSIDSQVINDERSRNALNNEGIKKGHKQNELENVLRHQPSSKRKPKSHIPISTLSAAMNVAVEMRQCNGITKKTTTLNTVCNGTDHNSSDSDNKLQEDKRHSNSSCTEDGSQDESWASYKKRLQEKCRSLTNKKVCSGSNSTGKESEVSSSASSENIDPQDTTAATSTESDTFFISSDESDGESSEVVYFQENYGSSTSIGTASEGSLNSLLSETGTEMTSSTGTLTSMGHEHLLTPPPPPPPMILSATVKDKDTVAKLSNSAYFGCNTEATKVKKNVKVENATHKQIKQSKSSKHPKSDALELQKNVTENSKNIFTSLVSLKAHSRDKSKNKNKDVEKKKMNKNSHQPVFDMYGNNSPTKAKQIPAFIKENISPVIKKQEKSYMKSFLVNDRPKTIHLSDNEEIKTPEIDFMFTRNSPNCDYPNNSNITKTKGIQTMSSIPPKYEHQLIVTPVQRYTNTKDKYVCPKGPIITENQQNLRHGNIQRPNSISNESQIYTPRIQRPNPPVTLNHNQERSKAAARVVLDFDGKVIYTTNSLDRKHHNVDHAVNMYTSAPNKSCDPYFNDKQFNNDNYNLCHGNHLQQNFQLSPISSYNSNTAYLQENGIIYAPSNVPFNHNTADYKCGDNRYMKDNPYQIKQTYEHQYPTSSMQSPHSHIPEKMQLFVPKRTDIRPFSYAGPNSADPYLSSPTNNLLPDPNISGLPVQETMLTRHNVNLHSQQMEKMDMSNEDRFNKMSDTYCVSPSSQTNNESILTKSPQSSMSTEDLFAVIHNCKKRMNIKTDSDISIASSSRSSSPSYLRPSSSKGTLAETGFLSPRSQIHLETSGDRRSWADFRPVDSVCNERKSLASDRLGPTKPTSMHDFKMLLLQARTSSQTSGQRKSAVEMLKLPPNQNSRNTPPSLPLNLSPRGSISFSAQNSPTIDLSVYNGHSTVPFKRGNRVRTSLQSRYIMYPPIFEDCSEDSENCGDIILNNPSITITAENKSEKENPECAHNSNKNKNRYSQIHKENSCDNETNIQVE